eukprot:m.117344 g.117344  ORF g.117344 m.117344 type:complete len:76 (-) comp12874_c0_seq1:1957-2184(-)
MHIKLNSFLVDGNLLINYVIISSHFSLPFSNFQFVVVVCLHSKEVRQLPMKETEFALIYLFGMKTWRQETPPLAT